jgi:hypothetical protein
VLLLREVLDLLGRLLDGLIELVELAQELVAAEAAADQGGDDRLHLGGDDVLGDEVALAEDGAEHPLGEQVLDDISSPARADVRLRVCWHRSKNLSNAALNSGFWACAVADPGDQPAGQVGHLVAELLDRLVEPLDVRLGVAEEVVEQLGHRGRVGEVVQPGQGGGAVLEQHRLPGVLEDVLASG